MIASTFAQIASTYDFLKNICLPAISYFLENVFVILCLLLSMPRGKACIYSYVHILFCQEIHEERITVSMIQEQLEVSWGTYILFKIKNSFVMDHLQNGIQLFFSLLELSWGKQIDQEID